MTGSANSLRRLKRLDSEASPRGWSPVCLNDISDVSYIEGTPLGHPEGKSVASFPDGEGGWTDGFVDEGLQARIHADARLICEARNALAALVEVAEAAAAFVEWKNYDPDYADELMQREHDADLARLEEALTGFGEDE